MISNKQWRQKCSLSTAEQTFEKTGAETNVVLFVIGCLLSTNLFAQEPSEENDNQPILMIDPAGFVGHNVRDISISPDEQLVAVAGGKVVRIWNIRTGNLKATLRGELLPSTKKGRANAVAFSPDGRFLIVGVSDSTQAGSTRVYDMSDLSKLHGLIKGEAGCTDRVVFSPDRKWLASYG